MTKSISIKAKIDPKKFSNKFNSSAQKAYFSNNRIYRTIKDAEDKIKRLQTRNAQSNPVIKSFLTNAPVDLSAEFGLEPGQGSEFANSVLEAAMEGSSKSIITFKKYKNFNSTKLGKYIVKLQSPELQELNFTDSSSTPLDWTDIVVNRPFTTADQEGIGKEYYIEHNLTQNQKKYSRSGRALMINTERNSISRLIYGFGGYTPYVLPSIIQPRKPGSKNFLDDIFASEDVLNKSSNYVAASVRKISNRGRNV